MATYAALRLQRERAKSMEDQEAVEDLGDALAETEDFYHSMREAPDDAEYSENYPDE